MSDKLPPTRKVVPRNWAEKGLDFLMKDHYPNPIEAGATTITAALSGLLDMLRPKTVPQDVELPNPDGWQGIDPRIKEYLGVPDTGPVRRK